MTTKIKSAEHLEEHELNKLLKYLTIKEEWLYYVIVRLGISTALRFSDLSRLKWLDILNKDTIVLNEKKTGKRREIPPNKDLRDKLNVINEKMDSPQSD